MNLLYVFNGRQDMSMYNLLDLDVALAGTETKLFCPVSTDSAGTSNGCSNNQAMCEQLCLPLPGGLFSCSCATGFQLNADNRTCAPYQSYLVISMLTAIKGFSLEGSDHSEAMVPVAGRGMEVKMLRKL